MTRDREDHWMAMTKDLPEVAWRISTRSASGAGGACVSAGPVLDRSGRVAVRHSYQPDADVIVCAGTEWRDFLAKIRENAFDLH